LTMCGGDKKGKYKNADYSDPTYKGEPCDEALKDGPIEKRHCTDMICCIIFIVYVVYAV